MNIFTAIKVAFALASALTAQASAEERVTCANIGASYDTLAYEPSVLEEPKADLQHRAMMYWAYTMAEEYGINWFTRARAGAGASELVSQARFFLEFSQDPGQWDCLVIGPVGQFLAEPEKVTWTVAQIVREASRHAKVFVVQYPPHERIAPPFLLYARLITTPQDYEMYRHYYEHLTRAYGAEVVHAWEDMTPTADGLHPDNESARRAARRVSEAVRQFFDSQP